MASASQADVKFEIGHVLFIDIVGYSKLLINEQSEQMQKLREIVRATEQFRSAEAAGKLLRLPTGDGGALVFRTSPESPVLCALEISKALKNHPELRVRMGIHSGPVNEITDLNEQANIAGAGINIAQRVMDCGDAGHILLSKHVADDLEQYPQWRSYLHDLGECEVKHGVRVHAVNLYTNEVGNAEVPEKFQKPKEVQPAPAIAASEAKPLGRSLTRIAALTLIIAAAVAAGFYLSSRRAGPKLLPSATVPAPVAIPEKSIAVLPFENLSEDKANAYFADGIQDEILTRLSKIADLKVISRTSTQHFKSSPDNLPQIAQRLGVANIVEGSVQKSGDSVRVNVQLIKAANDSHLWADTFDRKLTDIFSVETEIAKAIADSLRAKLSGAEEIAVAARPTENIEAHELYLKGRYFLAQRRIEGIKSAIEYFNQAITKDPNYALGYAGLADSYALLAQYSPLPVSEVLPKARAAAEKALSIDDKLSEGHVALGFVFLTDLNLKDAKAQCERAIELNPNYATAHYERGFIALAFGQFDQAIAEIKRALELDPVSVIMNTNLGRCYLFARRYPEAISQLRKTVELDPTFGPARHVLGAALLYSGDYAGAIREFEKSYEISRASDANVVHTHSLGYLSLAYAVKGEREKALQLLGQLQDLEQRNGAVSNYLRAKISAALGDKNEAMDWLGKSYRDKESFIIFLKVDPSYAVLQGDPRLERLANEILPPDSH